MPAAAIHACQVVHQYGSRRALVGIDLRIAAGELFALLGPNGSGKTTLFRLISTLLPVQQGSITVAGFDVARQTTQVRQHLGVVFQAPSLDRKLTVRENLTFHGPLVGLTGSRLRQATDAMLERFGVADRAGELVERLSGGLRRRVELAKGLLHRPAVLLLDEPSTGLDPAARADLWQLLVELRERDGTTVVLTTHLLEEANQVDRLAIMDGGNIVALDTPDALRATVGADLITIDAADPARLARDIRQQLGIEAVVVDGQIRVQADGGEQLLPRLIAEFRERLTSITLGRPTLEDVFINRTGHRLESPALPT
ncbi:MAG: ATP-binding cassette domain-containing protein [Planctomycetes bacterium]|nr:ATP-binding cassette domain-containing protein [Planctomycetota bacterium]